MGSVHLGAALAMGSVHLGAAQAMDSVQLCCTGYGLCSPVLHRLWALFNCDAQAMGSVHLCCIGYGYQCISHYGITSGARH